MEPTESNLHDILLGKPDVFSIERRAFNAATLATTLVCVFLFLETIFIGDSTAGIILSAIAIIIFATLYNLGRKDKERPWLVWVYLPSIYTILFTDWYFIDGSIGVSLMAAVAISGVSPIILNQKQIVAGASIAGVFYTALLLISIFSYESLPQHNISYRISIDKILEVVIISAGLALLIYLVMKSFRHQRENANELTLELIELNNSLNTSNNDLKEAIAEIQELREIIPICSYCKKIRTDDGAWDVVEKYISKHIEVKFSHSICPGCYDKERNKIKKDYS